MASFNKITIVGYLGRDPEIKFTPAGDAVCAFSVATTEKGKEGNEITTWFRVTTWRRQAEVANQYLHKGSQVYIEGRLRLNEYTDRDGNRRASLEVNCTEMQFLGGAGDGQASNERPHGGAEVARQSAVQRQARPALTEEVNDSDVPF